ncbi:MAG: phosphatidylserine decarboxylase family protein [Thermodesulfobacteriota bacterium]|nr:phosphatidylserine decarboxylase family protein [Thermodesulfobacteriota bacterium]
MNNFSRPDQPNQTAFPLAKAGYPLILASAFITAVFALLELIALSLTGLAVTIFICYFFRDPDRVVPNKNGAVVSPADGKVVEACIKENNPYFKGRCLKISIFMSVFNVHVNRIPHEGKIEKINYYPGKFIPANFNKASSDNERNAVFIKTDLGKKYCVVQIAGLIARRIICKVHDGDKMVRGQRFGMICFGSRLDVYLPDDTNLNVCIEDRVKAGTSILGCLS